MKKLLVFLILVALGLTGLAYYTKYTAARGGEETYTTTPVGVGSLRDIINCNASVQPLDVKPICTMIAGRVVQLNPDFGTEVLEGQVLVRLDPTEARLKRDEAVAAQHQASLAVQVAEKKLLEAKAGRSAAQRALDKLLQIPETSRGALDQAKAEGLLAVQDSMVHSAESAVAFARGNVEVAQVNVAKAEYGLKLRTIEVPRFIYANDTNNKPAVGEVKLDAATSAGKRKFIVLDRKVELGQNVDPHQPLFLLAAGLEAMQLHALVPEADIGRITMGQEAEFSVKALGEDHKLPAKVAEIRPMPPTSQGAIYYKVLLNVANKKSAKTGEWELRPGMTAQVEILHQTHRDVWKLPVNAKNFLLDEHFQTPEAKDKLARLEKQKDRNDWWPVWVLRDKKPYPIIVRLGGVNAQGEPGIKDALFYEVLEWDPELKLQPDPNKPETIPEVIIGAPPVRKGFLSDLIPNIKL